MALYTIFGGRGFIGSEIVSQLNALGHTSFVPSRNDHSIFKRDLGVVIYCAGNGDCKNTPFSVLDANVSLLANILKHSTFTRLIYISSTRVYMNQQHASEHDNLTVCSNDNRRLFNLTKLVGEEICLKSGREVCILRPSNVYGVALGSPLFLPTITRNAIENGNVNMYVSPDYAKDYVSVTDVANCCIMLSTDERAMNKTINIAAGYNITAQQLADTLQKNIKCEIIWHGCDSLSEKFPQTDISSLQRLLPRFNPKNVIDDMNLMIIDFKEKLKKGTDMKILDCTLRDGGYYNDWDFDAELVKSYLNAVSGSGIEYVELGLRNFPKAGFLGPFAYSSESYLKTLNLPDGVTYGVMVDAKTVLSSPLSIEDAVDQLFCKETESCVSLVRIAAHFYEVEDSKKLQSV